MGNPKPVAFDPGGGLRPGARLWAWRLSAVGTSSIASGERCESVAEKRSKQRTTAYTGLLAHATDVQPRMPLNNTE
jgi:hypothetical protein